MYQERIIGIGYKICDDNNGFLNSVVFGVKETFPVILVPHIFYLEKLRKS